MKVYAVFFASDETLEWELDILFSNEEAAKAFVAREELENEWIERKIEHWAIHDRDPYSDEGQKLLGED